MKQFHKIIFIVIIQLFFGCNSPTDKTVEIQDKPTITQGVWGKVQFWEGDFMPMATGKISPVERRVYIYDLTSMQKVDQIPYKPFYRKIFTNVIDSALSNSKGFFQIPLAEGKYSIFVKEDSLYYSNSLDGQGNIFPFTVKKDSLTQLEFNITYKATF